MSWKGKSEDQISKEESTTSDESSNQQTSIVTYAINQKEGNQHSQDAPLLLGPDLDENTPTTSNAGVRRASRFSLDLSSSASKYQEYIRPSVWMDEISKLSSKMSSVLSKKTDTGKSFGEGPHTDSSYLANPPRFTFLQAIDVPEEGKGNTLFYNQFLAYEALPKEIKQKISSITRFSRL